MNWSAEGLTLEGSAPRGFLRRKDTHMGRTRFVAFMVALVLFLSFFALVSWYAGASLGGMP